MAPIIQIDRACKRFGRKTVLKDVSLEVPEGVVFALLGENGAGKSTLIRGMLGYHKFEEGTVRVLDLDPRQKPLDVRRQVGYVSDAPALYEWMSVADIGWFASASTPTGTSIVIEPLPKNSSYLLLQNQRSIERDASPSSIGFSHGVRIRNC